MDWRRGYIGRRSALPAAIVCCLLLLQWMTSAAVECRTRHFSDSHAQPHHGSLPTTSALLDQWWRDETQRAAALAQKVALDIIAVLIESTPPRYRLPPFRCTPLLTRAGAWSTCSCRCESLDDASAAQCTVCRRLRLRSYSSSSADLRPQHHPLQPSELATLDTALASLYSTSAQTAQQCPARLDSYYHFLRLHDALLTAPQRLHSLFPSIPTISSASYPAVQAVSSSPQLSTLPTASQLRRHLASAAWSTAWSGGGGGGGLGYQVRCDAGDGGAVLLWSMGGGGGGGFHATSERLSDGDWTVRWQGGAGGGAGLQWAGHSLGGGSGGERRCEASLPAGTAAHFTSVSASHGASPDVSSRHALSAASLAQLNRTLAVRMQRCIGRGHTLRVSGGGGAGGGHQLRVRLRDAAGVEVVANTRHELSFHFELAIDRRIVDALGKEV